MQRDLCDVLWIYPETKHARYRQCALFDDILISFYNIYIYVCFISGGLFSWHFVGVLFLPNNIVVTCSWTSLVAKKALLNSSVLRVYVGNDASLQTYHPIQECTINLYDVRANPKTTLSMNAPRPLDAPYLHLHGKIWKVYGHDRIGLYVILLSQWLTF